MIVMISVVIPVYNSEKFLKRAFDSLLNQTIGFENLEIIFVDDKSTDNSRDIIQNYSDEYGNVKYYFLDWNSGSGGTPRNVGMLHATKDYLMFLDSDDLFVKDACEVLYREITSDDVDIVSGLRTSDDSVPTSELWKTILTNPFDDNQIRNNKLNELLKNFPLKVNSVDDYGPIIGDFAFTSKIYKRSFIEKNSIKFPDGITAEDSVFLCNALLSANGIKYIDKIVYHYFIKKGDDLVHSSFDNSKNTLKGLLKAFYGMHYLSIDKNKSNIFKMFLLPRKLNYFLYDRLMHSDLSVGDTLELLIYASPLFKSCIDYNKDIKLDLFHFIANKDYENALRFIFGENILNQKDIKIISDEDSFADEYHLIKFQSDSWFNQFESEKPDLFIFKECENEEIQNYCNKNNIHLISISDTGYDFLQLLDSIKFKYVPYLEHIVLFYELDDLCQINNIHNHFHSINYPFKHLKLLTSKDNLFLSNAMLKSDLKTLNLDENYYFCFADLNLDSNFIQKGLFDSNISDDFKNIVFRSSKFEEVISKIVLG